MYNTSITVQDSIKSQPWIVGKSKFFEINLVTISSFQFIHNVKLGLKQWRFNIEKLYLK